MILSNGNDPKTARQLMETNAWDWLNETFDDPLLVNVLSGSSMKLELRKESLPLFTFMHCNSSYIESAWRLRGGGSLIAQSLINDIEAMGGKVVCNAEVVELKETNGCITEAICQDGRRYAADTFISDIHPCGGMFPGEGKSEDTARLPPSYDRAEQHLRHVHRLTGTETAEAALLQP